jgi:nucleoid-associated protein YgaU
MKWFFGLCRRIAVMTGLVGCALALRWMTSETLDQVSTTDLESLAAALLAGVAWTAYGWLVVAVAATLVGQLPGRVGRAASSVAVGITSEASRRLLRLALGVAAAAPLTVGAASAAPIVNGGSHTAHVVGAESCPSIDHIPSDPRDGFSEHDWASVERPSTVDMTDSADRGARRPASRHRPTGGRDWAPIERPSAISLGAARRADNDRIPVPDRPTVGTTTRYTEFPSVKRPKPQPKTTSPNRVVVRRGDSLWSIAARELGPRATDRAIAARWPQWYAANATVIGTNPHLLLPGQVLRVPGDSRTEHRFAHPPIQEKQP